MIFFHRLIPLNFRRSNACGQLATFLILLMVVVLIFILVTVNLGEVSLKALTISNAADSAALFLNSQLATKAHIFKVALDNSGGDCYNGYTCTKRCSNDGILPLVSAIVVVIIYIIAVVASGGTVTASGAAIAGSIGGGIGGGITYETPEGVATGAIQGYAIGYSIGSAVNYFGVERLGAPPGSIGKPAPQLLINHPLRIAVAIGLVTGGQIYGGYANEKMTSAAFANVSKQLNALNEKDALIQGTYFNALSQVVDDPAMVEDTTDINSNGDTQEKVLRFLVWWEEQLNILKEATSTIKAETNDFLGELDEISRDFYSLWELSKEPSKDFAAEIGSDHPLARKEVTSDGAIVKAWRDLEAAGKTIEAYKGYKDASYTLRTRLHTPWLLKEPKGYFPPFDEETALIDELFGFYAFVQPLFNNRKNAAKTWDSWIGQFYDRDPNSTTDLYDVWWIYINGGDLPGVGGAKRLHFSGLEAWKAQLEEIKKKVPICDFDKCDPDVSTNCQALNYPCKFNGKYTTDSDPYNRDEFEAAETAITGIIKEMEGVRTRVKKFYDNSNLGLIAESRKSAEYKWTDSRGEHTVTVSLSPVDFKIPRIFTSKEKVPPWGKDLKHRDCVTFTDYDGDITVTVTRKDPADKKIGILGFWNPSGGKGDGFMEIKRKGYGRYRYNSFDKSNSWDVGLDKPIDKP